MALTDWSVHASDGELLEAASDIEAVLDLDGRALDLSPAFRRLMFDFEEAIVELVVRAAEARGRARVAREDARALQAAARQTNTVASERRAASERLGARRA